VVLTIAAASSSRSRLSSSGYAANFALVALYLALLLPLPVASLRPSRSHLNGGGAVFTWGNAIAGAIAWWGPLALS
jgi:hypothetical protein